MSRDTVTAFKVALFIVSLGAAFVWLSNGCAPAANVPPGCDPRGEYEALLVSCNRLAGTLQESIECEQRVRRYCNRPLRDAGGQ